MEMNKVRCTCSCHTSNGMIMHMQACCKDGWIDVPVIKQYVRDGDWFRYYEPELGYVTEQHSEMFTGKVVINDAWEVLEETLGRVYVVKPKKKEDGE